MSSAAIAADLILVVAMLESVRTALLHCPLYEGIPGVLLKSPAWQCVAKDSALLYLFNLYFAVKGLA
jgi:hypothetical protein